MLSVSRGAVGLALAIALDVGGMCGNGMCQKRGRDSLPVAVRWEVRLFIYRVSVSFYVPRLLILYLVGGVVTKLRLVPVGNGSLKEVSR